MKPFYVMSKGAKVTTVTFFEENNSEIGTLSIDNDILDVVDRDRIALLMIADDMLDQIINSV